MGKSLAAPGGPLRRRRDRAGQRPAARLYPAQTAVQIGRSDARRGVSGSARQRDVFTSSPRCAGRDDRGVQPGRRQDLDGRGSRPGRQPGEPSGGRHRRGHARRHTVRAARLSKPSRDRRRAPGKARA